MREELVYLLPYIFSDTSGAPEGKSITRYFFLWGLCTSVVYYFTYFSACDFEYNLNTLLSKWG